MVPTGKRRVKFLPQASSPGGAGGGGNPVAEANSWVDALPGPLPSLVRAGPRVNLSSATPASRDHTLSDLAAEARLWPVEIRVSGRFR